MLMLLLSFIFNAPVIKCTYITRLPYLNTFSEWPFVSSKSAASLKEKKKERKNIKLNTNYEQRFYI